jgi:hypothetical protein
MKDKIMNFSKSLLLIVLWFCVAVPFAGGYVVGAGGFNLSTLNTPEPNETSLDDDGNVIVSRDLDNARAFYQKKGFNAAFAYEHSISDYFSVQAGLSYETRGEGGSVGLLAPKLTGDSTWDVSYRYVQIPIILIGSIPFGDNQKVELLAGVEYGRMIGDGTYHLFGRDTNDYPTTALGGDWENIYPDSSASILGDVKTDYGFTIGLGYQIQVPFGMVFFRPSYYIGMTKINIAGRKHRNVKLQLGYGFRLF